MATLISKGDLDVAAVFPQCLDNQFVSFQHFLKISTDGLSYKHPPIASKRQKDTIMEFNRSLVYGQQVCVNRASLVNCKPLYELYLPGDRRCEIDEIGNLLENQALIPYLFKGTTIEGGFSRDPDGNSAFENLLEHHDNKIKFLTLGATEKEANRTAARIATAFETRADHLSRIAEDGDLYPDMLAELLPCAKLVESPKAGEKLRTKIFQLSDLISRKTAVRRRAPLGSSIERLTREEVYRELFIQECRCGKSLESKDCVCIPEGNFARLSNIDDIKIQFCLKTLVDLVYATNVPDSLHRYLMTPWQLPSRNVLQDFGAVELELAATIDDVAREAFAHSQRLHASFGEAMVLPMLSELSLSDICKIREFREWREFMCKQEKILLNPLEGAHSFDEFQESFASLQKKISEYWIDKKFESRSGKRYRSFVSAVFQIGKYTVQFGVRCIPEIRTPEIFVLDKAIDYVASQSERITVGPAKLLFQVFDDEARSVDNSRSWSIEWMRKKVAWNKKELLELLREERGKAACKLLNTGANMADVSGG